MNNIDETLAWQRYKACADYKNANNYYSMVDENYRYYQGDQWGNTVSNGLPMPVFNVIKPVIRYKISIIMQNDTSVLFTSENTRDPQFETLQEISDVLTNYERISDHCSNIAVAMIEIHHGGFDTHKYLNEVKYGNNSFNEVFDQYSVKYHI